MEKKFYTYNLTNKNNLRGNSEYICYNYGDDTYIDYVTDKYINNEKSNLTGCNFNSITTDEALLKIENIIFDTDDFIKYSFSVANEINPDFDIDAFGEYVLYLQDDIKSYYKKDFAGNQKVR